MELVTLMTRWEITTTNSAGIISELYDIYNSTTNDDEELTIPFIPNEQLAVRLNNYYYFGWSGDKYSSPMVEKYQQLAESPVVWQVEVAKAFWEVHGDELLRQWELFQKEYDPLASYDVHEGTGYSHTGGSSLTKSGFDSKVRTGMVTNKDYSYAYDSDTQKQDGESTTDYGDSMHGLTDLVTYDSGNSTTDTADDTLTVHKSGNLGTTSFTKLLQDDMQLWVWDFYTKFFFPAIDSMIALPIY